MQTDQIMNGALSLHFSWQEAFHTNHREITNDWENDSILINITKTAERMEAVRALLGVPLTVTSWYRNTQLNRAVGGATNSDHLYGNAVDFIAPQYGKPLDICRAIIRVKEHIEFKQLILEHTWVHISFSPIPNTQPKLEVLSLLSGGRYATGLTDQFGNPY